MSQHLEQVEFNDFVHNNWEHCFDSNLSEDFMPDKIEDKTICSNVLETSLGGDAGSP